MFVEYFTQAENIQKFSDQQCSFSPLKGGKSSSVEEIRPLLSCYKDGKTVIGTDSMLKLPIWNLTAEASKQILSGKPVRIRHEPYGPADRKREESTVMKKRYSGNIKRKIALAAVTLASF